LQKKKIFYISWIPPIEGSGATLAMRRHFVEHRDFDIFVATTAEFSETGIPSLQVKRPKWLQRLSNTRLVRAVRNFELLIDGPRLSSQVVEAAKQFRPDAVFTVADMTLCEQAWKLAKKLGVPLGVNFQDWWPRGQFYYTFEKPYFWVRPILEYRFRRLYRKADLAFCTSQGMREFLGPHPNAHVLYPIGANDDETLQPIAEIGDQAAAGLPMAEDGGLRTEQNAELHNSEKLKTLYATARARRKRRLIYTGTAFGSYGKMLRELARELEKQEEWELVIYGNTPDWPKEELEAAKKTGLYRGLLKFDELQRELHASDACLAVMSFEPKLEVMMRTSFTTKMLDYSRVGKPVVLWGPRYCSPIRLAKPRNAALCVESEDVQELVSALKELSSKNDIRCKISIEAKHLADGEFSHTRIHEVFVRCLQAVLYPSQVQGPSFSR
jgi:glycosyltransferase involved in cell wall biosynthesis